MKKIILIVLLALSLNGSEFMCKDAFSRYKKHFNAFVFAYARQDVLQMRVSNGMVIFYIEKSLVECGDDWVAREQALKTRDDAIRISSVLKRL